MHTALIALGANLGDPLATLQRAIDRLSRDRHVHSWRCSDLYCTSPVSSIPQSNYWNGVLLLRTREPPWMLFSRLKRVERFLGRTRPKQRDVARHVDLDFLWSSQLTSKTPYLQLPHPRMLERRFVLVPLLELVPALPGLPSLQDALAACPSEQRILDRHRLGKKKAP
ncbi:MAG: 2-amino-4-hydroxy-6-hydroxymethyldihydropteridine diphosphokinase [Chlamydiia bacterium]